MNIDKRDHFPSSGPPDTEKQKKVTLPVETKSHCKFVIENAISEFNS